MKKILAVVLSLGLFGCATTAKYEARLNTFIGASEDSLIASWGVPDKVYHLKDGKKAVEYARKTIVQTGGNLQAQPRTVYHTGTIGDKPYSGTSTEYVLERTPLTRHKLFCMTSFIIDTSGRVESWHHEGNDCVASD